MKRPSKQNNAPALDNLATQQKVAEGTANASSSRKKPLGQIQRTTTKPVQHEEPRTERSERKAVAAGHKSQAVKERAPSRRKKSLDLTQRSPVNPVLLEETGTAPPEAIRDGRKTTAKKAKKPKQIRRNVTLSESENDLLLEIKQRCEDAGIKIKKNELLRIGVTLLKNMKTSKINAGWANLPTVKTKHSGTV